MYIFDLLSGLKQSTADLATFEYRIVCSGELYNSKVLTTDWRKSDGTRYLLQKPFELYVCSRPFNDYPQELAVIFRASLATKTRENVSYTSYFDQEIAQDLAALLSLFCRRLITVSSKVRETYDRSSRGEPYVDLPIGFLNSARIVNWKRHPATVIYDWKGVVQDIINYNPCPLPVDPEYLQNLLTALPDLPQRENFIFSVRLYALALEHLINDVELAYQFLISSIEAIANEVFKSYVPEKQEMLKTKESVQKMALKFGLSETQAEELALEACKGIPWSNRKFIKFILDYTDDRLWLEEDELFRAPDTLLPKKDDFESALRQIYSMRGKSTHAGHSYPVAARAGTGPLIPAEIMLEVGGIGGNGNKSNQSIFPPVTWFERVVNLALSTFLQKSTSFLAKDATPK